MPTSCSVEALSGANVVQLERNGVQPCADEVEMKANRGAQLGSGHGDALVPVPGRFHASKLFPDVPLSVHRKAL
jgi:hypothetical protein